MNKVYRKLPLLTKRAHEELKKLKEITKEDIVITLDERGEPCYSITNKSITAKDKEELLEEILKWKNKI